MQVLLPGRQTSYALNTDDFVGTLNVKAARTRRCGQTLVWHDAANPGLALEVATVVLDPAWTAASLQVSWKTATFDQNARP